MKRNTHLTRKKALYYKKENNVKQEKWKISWNFVRVDCDFVAINMSGPVGQLFSKLTAVVASPASSVQNHHKIVIDRKTIEKTWKYMDKVIFKMFDQSVEILKFFCRSDFTWNQFWRIYNFFKVPFSAILDRGCEFAKFLCLWMSYDGRLQKFANFDFT